MVIPVCICLRVIWSCWFLCFLREGMLHRRDRYFPGDSCIGHGMFTATRTVGLDTFPYQLQDCGIRDELIQLQALPGFWSFKKLDGTLVVEMNARRAIDNEYGPGRSLE